VQCTRDLSKEDRNACLKHTESYVPGYCGISTGGELYGSNCAVQYDATCLFYNASAVQNAAAAPPPPPPAGTTNDGNNGNKLILESGKFSDIQLS
jgi:hypothetical protein